MRRGTQGHVAEPREPMQAPAWRGGNKCMRDIFYILYSYKYKRPDYRNSLTHKTALPFKCVISSLFLRVGLCSLLFFSFQDTWDYAIRWIRARGSSRVDVVEFGSMQSSSTHVLKSRFR